MPTSQLISRRITPPLSLPPLPHTAAGLRLTWRPVRARDAQAIHQLTATAASVDDPLRHIARAETVRTLRDERFTPHTDGIVAFAPDGSAVAYGVSLAHAAPEQDPARIVAPHLEVALEGTVHPAYRSHGIGGALLAWQQARGLQLLAQSDQTMPALLTTHTGDSAQSPARLYAAAGFSPARSWSTMRRAATTPVPRRVMPAGVRLRRFSLRYSEGTRVALNDAFRDHWGFTPITRREWRVQGRGDHFSPGLSCLAVSGRGTRADPRRVVGFVLSAVSRKEWALHGQRFGTLDAVGVVREWRGAGLSTPLIASALEAHAQRGHASVDLDVDADNPSGALAMYRRLGFVERDRSVSYAKQF